MAGEMMDKIGARKLFSIFSVCSLATLVLYFGYVNVLVHIPSWFKGRKNNIQLGLNTPSKGPYDDHESSQLLMINSEESESDKSGSEEADIDTLSSN